MRRRHAARLPEQGRRKREKNVRRVVAISIVQFTHFIFSARTRSGLSPARAPRGQAVGLFVCLCLYELVCLPSFICFLGVPPPPRCASISPQARGVLFPRFGCSFLFLLFFGVLCFFACALCLSFSFLFLLCFAVLFSTFFVFRFSLFQCI